MPRCSVVVPVYNKAHLTRRCVDQLLASSTPACPFEIIVVDDGSRDATPRLLASYGDRIRVVTHATNQAFATACNDGAAVARGDYLVFLNNDTVPMRGWLEALVRYAEARPRVGLVGAKLLYPDGTIQHAGMAVCQDLHPRHIYVGFPADHPAVNKARRMQMVTAACGLVPRDVFARAGGFDPAFVNGFEDTDLCLRLNALGYEVHYCPESVLVHFESVSEGRFQFEQRNGALFRERWGQTIRPDDLSYYAEDELIRIDYYANHMELTVSSELGVAKDKEGFGDMEKVLARRARQVYALVRENVALRAAAGTVPDCHALPEGGTTGGAGQPAPDAGLPARLRPSAEVPRGTRPAVGRGGPVTKALGVNLLGLLQSEKGVGEHCRATVRALEAAGIPYALNNFEDSGSANVDTTLSDFSTYNPYPVNLIILNADAGQMLSSRMRWYLQGRYNIGYWNWELESFPEEWRGSFELFDEIWSPSTFSQQSIARLSPIPVSCVPIAVAPPLPRPRAPGREQFQLPPGAFVFLFIFDFHSYFERKNPLAVIKAFKRAFPRRRDVVLVLKTSRDEAAPIEFAEMLTACAGRPNIRVVRDVLDRDKMYALLGLCDAYVSLHRSEGFGIPLAEAMALGKPVIATGYSANLDFMNEDNSFLVRYQRVAIEEDHGPYRRGAEWADADVAHAAEQMRRVVEAPEATARVAARARADIGRLLSPHAVGRLMRDRLESISRLALPGDDGSLVPVSQRPAA